jgi:hypothetical protein
MVSFNYLPQGISMFWHKIGGANENLVLDLSILVERKF